MHQTPNRTGILPFADPKNKRPHDAYHRLFPKSRWLPAHLWKLLGTEPCGADPAGKEQDDFFFTTDLKLTPAEVIGGFAGHWSIEDTFKNTKQSLGSEHPQTWNSQGPQPGAVISRWLYSVVPAWYIRYGYVKISLPIVPWYPAKTRPSFQDALAALPRVLWRKRIITMFGNHTVPARITEFLINALTPAA